MVNFLDRIALSKDYCTILHPVKGTGSSPDSTLILIKKLKEDSEMKVSTVQEMHQLDRNAMEKYAIPGIILMENAGEAAYYVILNEFGIKN